MIKMPAVVNNLLQKEMNRKEFLQHIGIASLVVAGGGFIAKSLSSFVPGGTQGQASKTVAQGYGTSVYGGNKVNS